MKFKYTNSNNEESIIEAIPLTTELYKELLDVDKEFLENVVAGKEVFFAEKEYVEAASSMLKTFGKSDKEQTHSTSEDNCVLYVSKKTVLKAAQEAKQVKLTPKKNLRSHMVTSNIRSFKKEKMDLNVKMDQ